MFVEKRTPVCAYGISDIYCIFNSWPLATIAFTLSLVMLELRCCRFLISGCRDWPVTAGTGTGDRQFIEAWQLLLRRRRRQHVPHRLRGRRERLPAAGSPPAAAASSDPRVCPVETGAPGAVLGRERGLVSNSEQSKATNPDGERSCSFQQSTIL